MNQSARTEYFQQNPDLQTAYETVDGVLFKTESEALNWNGTSLTTHNRADFIQMHTLTEEDLTKNPSLAAQGLKVGDEVELPLTHTVTEDDLKGATSEATTYGMQPGDKVNIQESAE